MTGRPGILFPLSGISVIGGSGVGILFRFVVIDPFPESAKLTDGKNIATMNAVAMLRIEIFIENVE